MPSTGRRTNDRPLAGIRVLLVDRDLGLRESFQSVLAEYGAEVTALGSALEALEALESSRPDVLLFGDLATRESIYELARQVTVRACPMPIASISSWRREDKERELASGFRLHLDKPLQTGALVAAIAELAGRSNTPLSTTWNEARVAFARAPGSASSHRQRRARTRSDGRARQRAVTLLRRRTFVGDVGSLRKVI